MTRSLQTRLLWGLAVGTSAVLVAAGLVLYGLIRAELLAQFDATLASEARALATLVEEKDGHLQTELAEHGVPKLQLAGRPVYYTIWDSEGTALERSSGLGDAQLARFGGTPAHPEFRPVVLPGQRAGRMVGFHFTPHRDEQDDEPGADDGAFAQRTAPQPVAATLVVARDTLELSRTLLRIGWLLTGVFGGAVLLSLVVTAPIVRASLRPLKRISARIKSLDTKSLAERLDAADAPSEVGAVIDCLNGLLDRLADAFQRERAFSANVAHELRTPLAGLRSTMDVALSKPRESDEYRRSLQQCQVICQQAESLTENLLLLARLDSGQFQLQRESIELNELLHQVWSPLAARAEARGLKVDWQLNGQVEVRTDTALLTMILRNLLDNAVCYADDDEQIEINAQRQ